METTTIGNLSLENLDIEELQKRVNDLNINISKFEGVSISSDSNVDEFLEVVEKIKFDNYGRISNQDIKVHTYEDSDSIYLTYYRNKTKEELINDIKYHIEYEEQCRKHELAQYLKLKEKYEQ